MEQLKGFKLVVLVWFFVQIVQAQVVVTGVVMDGNTQKPLPNTEVYSKALVKTIRTDTAGKFLMSLEPTEQTLVFINYGYEILEYKINPIEKTNLIIELQTLGENLNEVVINQQRQKVFGIKKLKDVEGTAIYAGKKTEVVLIEQQVGNKASGNPRQAYAQVAGLNIYETEDAGLQLNIGGRGLDPNRSANFNTRQNGYDISADVLGYPESYYTPPLEALEEIQVIRGAASLQYGTQFGGLVNFKLKEPNRVKEIEIISRQGIGSFGLFNSFNSLSGTVDKVSYYTYFQYKDGDGFRPNSGFDSQNFYANVGYQFTENTKLTLESTYLTYLAQQAGGLTDKQFEENPNFSNRERNFFAVDWVLLNLKLEHQFSENTKGSLNVFRLDAQRNALGFREGGRPSTPDSPDIPRELIIDEFNNFGAEFRVLSNYHLFGIRNISLFGAKYYQSDNRSQQGIGNAGAAVDFSFNNEESSNSELIQSDFDLPNLNVALFGEHIFKLTNDFSVTPGFRFEYIKTESDGTFIEGTRVDQNTITRTVTEESKSLERNLFLLGLGLSYEPSKSFEAFANFSQNYRSVTFSDIQIESPNFIIDPNIQDETGYTFDLGVRGVIDDIIRYDVSGFSLFYDNRIDVARGNQSFRVLRSNVGAARILGIESLITANFSNWLFTENTGFHWQHFLNFAYTDSEFTDIFLPEEFQNNGLRKGNELQFVPKVNLKTGVELGYKNFKSSFQYTYISTQFTDSNNTPISVAAAGVTGEIPAYTIMDFSAEYTYKNWTLEAGVNNLLDESYFTRRATGYPGPGIIPSAPRNFYAVLQFKF